MAEDLSPFFSDCIKEFCFELGLEFSLSVLMKVIRKNIPATHISCAVLDVPTGKTSVIAVLNELSVALPSSPGGIKWLETLKEHRVPLPAKEDVVYLINNLKNLGSYYETFYSTDTIHSSLLSMLLFTDGHSQYYIGLRAVPAEAFTEHHAMLLVSLKNPVSELLRKIYLGETAPGKSMVNMAVATESFQQMLSRCKGLTTVFRQVQEVAATHFGVLIQGETGTGKEIVAEAIHESSQRRGRPFVKVNCGAIPESLMEAELFGYERGAFTGAIASHKGYFEQANTGTLYLDEIGELSPMAQVRLLRVLETHEIQRIGSPRRTYLDFRLIAATNKDLKIMVKEGNFRADLWYRLNSYTINVPPLRRRKEDIPALASHFCLISAVELGMDHCPELRPDIINDLLGRSWHGNVRQLRNWIDRAMVHTRSKGSSSLLSPLEDEEWPLPNQEPPFPPLAERYTLDGWNKYYIEWAIKKCGGRIQGAGGAAEFLGIKPTTLRSRMDKLAIYHPVYNKRRTPREDENTAVR